MDKKQEILRILQEIRTTEYSTIQSIDLLLEYGFRLTQYMAFSGEAMAEAKEQLHKKRQDAYKEAATRFRGMPASIMKDFISDHAAADHGYYELCNRCNACATHSLDLVRTAVSAIKTEMQSITFQKNR